MVVYVNVYGRLQEESRVIDRVAEESSRGSPDFTEASVDRHTKRTDRVSIHLLFPTTVFWSSTYRNV